MWVKGEQQAFMLTRFAKLLTGRRASATDRGATTSEATGQGSDLMARTFTRQQALAWYPRWSYTDREVVGRHLDRLGVRTFYTTDTEGYIGCVDAHGTHVMYFASGYAWFPRAQFAADCDDDWPLGFQLSSFEDRVPPTPSQREGTQVCPIHNIALPLSGVCDECLDET